MERVVTDRRGQLLLFIVMIFATFMDGLDGTIVSVVLPDVASFFNISAGDSSWIITVYFLSMAGLILIVGKIADKGAIKHVLMYGLLVFVLGSMACGLSITFPMLLASRAVQGVGAAMMASAAIMLTVKFLPTRLIPLGLVATSMGYSLGSSLGPFLGGLISENASWEWIFFINVPVGVLALFATWRIIPSDVFDGFRGFDYLGAALLFISLVSGMYCLESIPSRGFSDICKVLLVVFVVTFSLFIIRSLRVGDPVVDLGLFRMWKIDICMLVFVIVNLCYMGCMYLLPFYITKVLGYGTMMCGLILLIGGVATTTVSFRVGKLVLRYGSRFFSILSCLSLTIASILFVFVESNPLLFLGTGMVFLGLMWGFGGGPLATRVINVTPDESKGACSAMNTFLTYFGAAMGTASFSALFNVGSGSAGSSIHDLPPDVFMEGYVFSMMVCVAICLIGLFLSWAVKEGDFPKES